jgi:hypothetical protein
VLEAVALRPDADLPACGDLVGVRHFDALKTEGPPVDGLLTSN